MVPQLRSVPALSAAAELATGSFGSDGIASAPQSVTTLPTKPAEPRAQVDSSAPFSHEAVPLIAA